MAGMNIVTLDADIFHYNPNLKHVNLSSNYLVSLDTQLIESLTKLEHLDISHNLFMGLEAAMLSVGEEISVCS